jgi:hypothetical protein
MAAATLQSVITTTQNPRQSALQIATEPTVLCAGWWWCLERKQGGCYLVVIIVLCLCLCGRTAAGVGSDTGKVVIMLELESADTAVLTASCYH